MNFPYTNPIPKDEGVFQIQIGAITNLKSLENFIRSHEHIRWNGQPKLFSGFHIQQQLKLHRLLDDSQLTIFLFIA
jgi:hypothetical protein